MIVALPGLFSTFFLDSRLAIYFVSLQFCDYVWFYCNVSITKTRLFKYIEKFTSKNEKFSGKKLIFIIFLLKT